MVGFEGVEGLPVKIEEFGQYLFGVLAEEGCGYMRRRCRFDGRAGHLVCTGGGMVERWEHLAEVTLGVGGDFLEVQDEGDGNAVRLELLDPLGGGLPLKGRV